MKSFIQIRNSDARAEQVRRIEALTGARGPSAVVDFALAYTLAGLQPRATRTAQVGWLRTLAGDLTSNNQDGTPEEIVAFWEQEERRLEGDEAFPEWYDEHDRALLVRFVEESLG